VAEVVITPLIDIRMVGGDEILRLRENEEATLLAGARARIKVLPPQTLAEAGEVPVVLLGDHD
jgi:hypothetical protein